MSDQNQIQQEIRDKAYALGFVRCGFTSVAPIERDAAFQHWIDQGFAGSMGYLLRTRKERAHPALLLPGAKSAIVVAANTLNRRQREPRHTEGRVARYARGLDYHLVLRRRLEMLGAWVRERIDGTVRLRVVVDTAPLLERELAMRAGIGFIGKNTLLISPGVGSYTVLGTLITTLELTPDTPALPRCGQCDLCLRSCPTQAFVEPYQLDATRCISHSTIEHRESEPEERLSGRGDWVFGCDVCQDACPYNLPSKYSDAAADAELAPDDGVAALDLVTLLRLKSSAYRRLIASRAFARVSRVRWQRNAAIAAARVGIGNCDLDAALEAIGAGDHAVVVEAADWARRQRAHVEGPQHVGGES